MSLVWVTFPILSKQWERGSVWGTARQRGQRVEIVAKEDGRGEGGSKSDHWAPGVLRSTWLVGRDAQMTAQW